MIRSVDSRLTFLTQINKSQPGTWGLTDKLDQNTGLIQLCAVRNNDITLYYNL